MKKFVFTIIVSIAIFILSVMPVPEVKELEDVPLFDKWVHMVMYAGLTFAMWLDRRLQKIKIDKKYYVMQFVYPALFGGLMELVQAYCTTCRSGDWIDFEADAVGSLLAVILCFIANLIWKEKTSVQR